MELVDAPLREPRPGEALVRVEGCGVCASSLPVWEGRDWFSYPLEPGAPGHEPWGVVEEGPPGLVGRRVGFLCEQAFAASAVVPVEHVVPLPAGFHVPFPGEALACAVNVARRARVQPGDRVAIVGAGFIGSAVAQLVDAVLVRREDEPEDEFDVVIECAGTQDALDKASRLVAVRGRLVIAGYHQDGLRTVDLQSWNWRGIDVINAHERDPLVYVDAMREAVGTLDPRPLVTHRFPLERLDEAFEAARTRPPGFVKAWVQP